MSLAEMQQELADALEPLKAEIADLQVYAGRNQSPTPPSLDVYPGDPFQVGAGFGVRSKRLYWTVRARVNTADQAAQQVLLRMLDPADDASVEAALADVGAVVADTDGYVSGYRDELDGLLTCEWRVTVFA